MCPRILKSVVCQLTGKPNQGVKPAPLQPIPVVSEPREAVQENTGFSPNDLVFGHNVCGPLAVLKENSVDTEPPSNLREYVNVFRHCLFVAGCMAREKLCVSE